jgi:hypothetical protein
MASSLADPVASNNSVRARRIDAIPCVIARRGTSAGDSKNLALSARVDSASVTTRVSASRRAPGSLKPMCPFRPIPRICSAMPPRSAISAS